MCETSKKDIYITHVEHIYVNISFMLRIRFISMRQLNKSPHTVLFNCSTPDTYNYGLLLVHQWRGYGVLMFYTGLTPLVNAEKYIVTHGKN